MGSGIVVVGSLNLDVVASVRHLPAPGETVLSSALARYPGGKGANQAVAAARLGAAVRMIGRVGRDDAGETLLRSLRSQGVGVDAVMLTDEPTGTAYITTDDGGENAIVLFTGANGKLTPADIVQHRDLIREAAMVLTQLEIPLETVEQVAELCSTHSVPLMLDPAPARTLPKSLLERTTWITPNETEAAVLLDAEVERSADAASRGAKILSMGPWRVVLKLGERGSYMAGDDGWSVATGAFAVSAVDTTAAGDVFNGAFAFCLVRGKSAEDSARFAAAAAAISVTRAGAQPSMPRADEVEALLANGKMRRAGRSVV